MKRTNALCLLLALLLALLGSGAALPGSDAAVALWEPPSTGQARLSLIRQMPDNTAATLRPDCFQPGELRGFSAAVNEPCRFLKYVPGDEPVYFAFPGDGGHVLLGYEKDGGVVWAGPGSRDGVRIAMLGDSVLAGQVGGEAPYTITKHLISDTVSRELGVPVDCFAVGGMGWASTRYCGYTAETYLPKVDLRGYTAVVLQFGHNDFDAPLGSYTDTDAKTVLGAVYRCCEYIQRKYPTIQIILSTPTLCTGKTGVFPDWDFTVPHEAGWSARDLRDEFRLFCEMYHIPLIEGDRCFNAWNVEELMGDHVHPNEEGYLVAGRYFAGQLGALL